MRFILIHGGFHGAWCWDRVVPELERLGHQALALDLPGHGERAAERPANYKGRIQPILDELRALRDEVRALRALFPPAFESGEAVLLKTGRGGR